MMMSPNPRRQAPMMSNRGMGADCRLDIFLLDFWRKPQRFFEDGCPEMNFSIGTGLFVTDFAQCVL